MIRTTIHSFNKEINIGKKATLAEFVSEFRDGVREAVDYIWNNKFQYETEIDGAKVIKSWDLENNKLDVPKYVSTAQIKNGTRLTARGFKCCIDQAIGIIKAVVNKRIKDLNKKDWLLKNGGKVGKKLQQRLSKPITKPDCKSINCEINSLCAQVKFEENNTGFDGWINLKCLFNDVKASKISIPLKHYRKSLKWSKAGKPMASFLINEKTIQIRWDVEKPELKVEGDVVAIDQGKTTVLSCSNDWASQKDDHGHDLSSIIEKLARKKKGSKNFESCQQHRLNHINWTVNKMPIRGIREIKLEEIININYGRNVSREMKHFTNPLIEKSIEKRCEEEGVSFTLVKNEFNSQRCSDCGWVQKSNRKKKVFLCKKCGLEMDADFNSSRNILIRDTLWVLPFGFRLLKYNRKGFYWLPQGLYFDTGEELPVPPYNIEAI